MMYKAIGTLAAALAVLLLGTVAVDTLAPGLTLAAAAEDAPSQKPQKTRRVPTMSERTYKKLSEVQLAMDAKDYQGALKILNDMINDKGLNGNERGQVHNMFAYAYFSLENYDKAIYHYEQVVAQGEDIPEGLEVGTLYSLAQLYFVTDKYQKSLDYMRLWLTKANNPGPEPHIFMGQVYYQMKDWNNAIKQIELGIDIARTRNTAIKENWWQLLRYLYFEKEDWGKVLEILEILVRDFPKREYWIQLAGVYGQEGQEKKQLYAMEAASVGKFLTTESDITSYAGLLMQDEVPSRAAKYLAKGIKDGVVKDTSKNLQILGQAYQVAQDVDKAIPVFQKAAAKADDGEIYARLAQLYLEKDDHKQCVEAADNALRKGGIKKRQTTYVVRGMCLFNASKLQGARDSFSEGARIARDARDSSNERICRQWITYIDREQVRREQIEKSI
jgi:tetratricopeptide (TPR) repeat protein